MRSQPANKIDEQQEKKGSFIVMAAFFFSICESLFIKKTPKRNEKNI